MALTFPLSLAGFLDELAFVTVTFDLSEAVETNETGGGEIIAADYGPRLWQGTVTLNTRPHADAERLLARVRTLFDARASFLISPPHMRTTTGTVKLNAQQNNREMKFSFLADGQTIPRGSFIGFTYGSNPTRRALHQLVEDATADGTGITGWAEVTPAIRPGASGGATINLATPSCTAKAIPGSLQGSSHEAVISRGCSFAWRQTLR
jgi:hypothetical protein